MQRLKTTAIAIVEASLLLIVIRWVNLWWALPLAALIWWYQARKTERWDQAVLGIALGSLVVVLALNANLLGQVLVVISYGWWQMGRHFYAKNQNFQVWQAGWLEFLALSAAFSAEAIWHWPVVLVLVVVYVSSIAVARGFFSNGERAVRALALAWGLIVAEASFIFSIWLVQYVLPGSLLLVPQPAVVITALGYCFGSIYLAHASSRLSKARLAEYAIIGLCLVAIVVAGTHWNGSI